MYNCIYPVIFIEANIDLNIFVGAVAAWRELWEHGAGARVRGGQTLHAPAPHRGGGTLYLAAQAQHRPIQDSRYNANLSAGHG